MSNSLGSKFLKTSFEIGVNFRDVSIVGFHVVNANARNILPSISGLTTTKVMKQGYIAITIMWADSSNDIDLNLTVVNVTKEEHQLHLDYLERMKEETGTIPVWLSKDS